MSTIVFDDETVHIPDWVEDLESFRRWAETEDFPEHGRVCFLRGEVWVDMSKQQILSHIKIKDRYTRVLDALVESEGRGLYISDGAFLTHVAVEMAVIPDGIFLSAESQRTGSVRLVEGREEGYVEVEGSPDMVLEVVSRSSVHKDTVVLFEAYWEAGIREYWLVDARKDPARFDIYRHTPRGYVATRKQGGWLKSNVFGKSFRLTKQTGKPGYEYVLETR
jgi:Uma2 family endonuclease